MEGVVLVCGSWSIAGEDCDVSWIGRRIVELIYTRTRSFEVLRCMILSDGRLQDNVMRGSRFVVVSFHESERDSQM